ncbi:zinc finger protein 227-like isoform X2 [Gymnodraco acuticeps]|uniref:Zinc finger protein 227-like isoform X2 n=1 Tax=Gymnodraco acuticeps TaxID=8218 RepID=A0A6P8SU12_GYMAC|nr:zinc finger protein 227-like isoform X2 [Gymnodraco acuticeps]
MERETVCLTEFAGKGDLVNMSKVQMLLSLKQRLTAAAEDIFALFEKTIGEHDKEMSLSKEENERLQKLLDAVLQPQLRMHRADVQLLVVVQEEVLPDQQEFSTSLDQEDPEPPTQQEELGINQDGEQLHEGEEADITKSTFTPDPAKSEDDIEKPQSSQPHQRLTEHMETEADGDDCRGPEPARNSDPESSLQPKTGDSSEPNTEHSADWKETREPASGSNSMKNRQESVSDSSRSAANKPFSCSVCKKAFTYRRNIQRHMRVHTREKPIRSSVCKKSFSQSGSLKEHTKIHKGEKAFSCSFCTKTFAFSDSFKKHMRIHTGEKPYRCSVCKKPFSQSGSLKEHMRIHTGEKPYRCLVCKKAFSRNRSLKEHMRVHTGEEIYSCNVCDKRFKWCSDLKRHKCVGRQSSQLNAIQTEDNGEAEPPISRADQSSSAEHMEAEADGEDNE